MSNKEYAIIFDCDGTVLDTYQLIIETVYQTFAKMLPNYPLTYEEADAFFTVTVQTNFFPPSVAVILAVPAFLAVIRPFLFTVTIFELLDLQAGVSFVPLTFNVYDLPGFKVILELFSFNVYSPAIAVTPFLL